MGRYAKGDRQSPYFPRSDSALSVSQLAIHIYEHCVRTNIPFSDHQLSTSDTDSAPYPMISELGHRSVSVVIPTYNRKSLLTSP